ncbi:hypothetical protein [Endozoicomonas ascidiicola]|uniref:hypothetical protein n=1 Tax=Endozoicomonas ascidiicola TaxID=1698521 RepID=UPI00083547EB|nr:hypothetical protein [Endozoicomonas ascidiicola]
MFRLLKGIFIVSVLLASIAAGMGYFFSNKIGLMANQWVANLSPYVRISYENLDVDLSGKVILNNAYVDIQNDTQPPIHVQRIVVRFPDIYGLYQMAMSGDFYHVPPRLNIEFQGARLFFLDNSRLASHFTVRNALLNSNSVATCGANYLMGPKQLKRMGYSSNTLFNLGVNFEYFAFNQTMDLVFDAEIQGLGFSTLGMTLSNVAGLHYEALDAGDKVAIQRLSINYLDDGYTDKKVSFCANASGISKARYINNLVTQDDAYFSSVWGIIPGQEFRATYGSFFQNPRRIAINLELQQPLPLAKLDWDSTPPPISQLYIAINNKELLMPELTLNPVALGNRVDDLLMAFTQPEVPKPLPETKAAPVVDTQVPAQPSTEDRGQREMYTGQHQVFTPISIEELAEGEPRPIRITLFSGRQYEGLLESLDERLMKLKSDQAGGEVIRPVTLSRIASVEVLM